MLLFESSIALPMSIYSVKTCAQQQSSLAGTTLPPTIFYKLRSIPSYVITIPFSSSGFSNFDPADVSIPLGMTVIWFNDDNSLHSVTTTNNTAIIVKSGSLYSSYSTAPPQRIDSAPIPTNGGSFIHTFSKPGTYNYYDKFDPRMHGTINVGSAIEPGKNMNMIIAANTFI